LLAARFTGGGLSIPAGAQAARASTRTTGVRRISVC
jgi:hypothetical protein